MRNDQDARDASYDMWLAKLADASRAFEEAGKAIALCTLALTAYRLGSVARGEEPPCS